MVNSLRKVDFSHLTGHYTWTKFRPPPPEKILGAPLNRCHQRSMTFDDVIRHFSFFVPSGVIWCADFEFSIRLSFICVEIGSLGS